MTLPIERKLQSYLEGSKLDTWQESDDGLYWRIVDLDDPTLAASTKLLDREERDRAARFRFARDRDRYVAAHTSLRLNLSEFLNQAPDRIKFTRGAYGKPAIPNNHEWIFNLSHSEGLGLIVVAPTARFENVGADIECVRSMPDWQMLAHEYFSLDEYQSLKRLDDNDRASAFLRCWTRKEACLKAIGDGLTVPTQQFSIGIHSETTATMIASEGREHRVHARILHEDDVCIAALAWCQKPMLRERKSDEFTVSSLGMSEFKPKNRDATI